MKVITLSRQLGAHGEQVASAVAQALDLRLVTLETINRAAEQAGVPQTALAELEREGGSGLVNQVLKALRAMPSLQSGDPFASSVSGEDKEGSDASVLPMPFSGLFSTTAPPISASLDGYVRMVGLVVRGLAREGDVLIVGRGAQRLLKENAGVLHVQIVAPRVQRVKEVKDRLKSSKRAALGRVRASDRARADYLRRYHGANWLDASLYHLVINTGLVSVETAVDLIVTAQKALADSRDEHPSDE